jgi:hypothetical protein
VKFIFQLNQIVTSTIILLWSSSPISSTYAADDTRRVLDRCQISFSQMQSNNLGGEAWSWTHRHQDYARRWAGLVAKMARSDMDKFLKGKDSENARKRHNANRLRFETLFLELLLEAQVHNWDLEKTADTLSSLTTLPLAYSKLMLAYYGLHNKILPTIDEAWIHELLSHIPIEKLDHFPLKPNLTLKLTDFTNSELAQAYRNWRNGQDFHPPLSPRLDDPLWNADWEHAKAQLLSQLETDDVSNIESRLYGHLWRALGAYVERAQLSVLSSTAPNDIIPGSAIRLQAKAHADGWRVSFTRSNQNQLLVIEGFLESKSSASGVAARGAHQHYSWMQRLINDPYSIQLFGMQHPPDQLVLRRKDGTVALPKDLQHDFNQLSETDFPLWFANTFGHDFYEVFIPNDELIHTTALKAYLDVEILPFKLTGSVHDKRVYVDNFLKELNFADDIHAVLLRMLATSAGFQPNQNLSPHFSSHDASSQIHSEADHLDADTMRMHYGFYWEDPKPLDGFGGRSEASFADGRLLGAFATNTRTYFTHLGAHLPAWQGSPYLLKLEKNHGSDARTGRAKALKAINQVMGELIKEHNASDEIPSDQKIEPKSLETAEGVGRAVEILKSFALPILKEPERKELRA